MHKLKAILTTFVLFWTLAIQSQTPTHIKTGYTLTWQDEFDGVALDTTKWMYRAQGTKRGFATVRKENVYLDSLGHLVIEATKKDSNYYVGQIATANKIMFRYGYFECRLQVNQKIGPSTAFWLQSPTFKKYPEDLIKGGAEIDILEYRRKVSTDEVHHTIHWGGYGKQHEQKGKSPTFKNIDKGFHTFGLEWTPNHYTFYVDGKASWTTKKSISKALQFIILSVEMNEWSGNPSETIFPDKAVYDYVRVYSKN